MRIGLVATHSWPIDPEHGTPAHTGDSVIVDLGIALEELGHEVLFVAPVGSWCPKNGALLKMNASLGNAKPTALDCEMEAFGTHQSALLSCDVVHDFSIKKTIATALHRLGRATVSTPLGGRYDWTPNPANVCVWSQAMKERALRGAHDYDGTLTPEMGGPAQAPLKDMHVVFGGINTEFYCPGDTPKENFLLWMNRWSPVKGYRMALRVARATRLPMVLAGEHPDNCLWQAEKDCALEAEKLAAELPNVKIEWLPANPHHHTAKRELYRRARALLYPVQFQEPFGLSMAEAMACGTPVVGTNYGSVPELVANGITGLVVGNDCEQLCDASAMIMKRYFVPDLDVVRGSAWEQFDRKVMAKNYQTQYEAVIRGEGWGA